MATLKGSLQVGIIRRGAVRAELKKYAQTAGIKVELDEERGLLGSVIFYEFTGSDEQMMQAEADIIRWVEQHNDR